MQRLVAQFLPEQMQLGDILHDRHLLSRLTVHIAKQGDGEIGPRRLPILIDQSNPLRQPGAGAPFLDKLLVSNLERGHIIGVEQLIQGVPSSQLTDDLT